MNLPYITLYICGIYILIVYLYDFEIFNQITEESLEVVLIVNTR